MTYQDEPPGKLRSFQAGGRVGVGRALVQVRVELAYTEALFSAERTWDLKALGNAAVRQVTIVPAARK